MLVTYVPDRRHKVLCLYCFVFIISEEIHNPTLVIPKMSKLTNASSQVIFMHYSVMMVTRLPRAASITNSFPEPSMLYFVHWFNHGHLSLIASRVNSQHTFQI